MNASDVISRIINILSESGYFQAEVEELRRKKAQIDSDIIRVGFIGVTSAGKSTMINALLGEEILPAEARPSSSQLVSCRKGKQREANIYFDDRPKLTLRGKKLTPEVISRYGTENLNSKNKESVKQIELVSPNLLLPGNVELVDSPGLDAYGLPGHEAITMENLLPSVDFCIFVTTCKSNSDSKMRSVLDIMARYDKPLIIIQNMIDSLRGSVDGKKSVVQVAEEHKNRIRRVVEGSKIRNKSGVCIVQISAINALKCRVVTCNGKKLNDKGNRIWRESGFEQFSLVLDAIPGNIAAHLNESRLFGIKETVDRIIRETETPKLSTAPCDNTDYMALFDMILENAGKRASDIVSDLTSCLEDVERYGIYNEADLTRIKEKHRSWTSHIVSLIQTSNKGITDFCRRLGESERDIRYTFIPSQASQLKIRTKAVTRECKQKGFWGGVKRFFTFGLCGYEKVSKDVCDWEATSRSVIAFLKSCRSDYAGQMKGWYDTVSGYRPHFVDVVAARERIKNEAKMRNLEAKTKMQILKRLNELNDSLPKLRSTNTGFDSDQVAPIVMKSQKISPLLYGQYIRIKEMIGNIHRITCSSLFKGKAIGIFSWDMPSVDIFFKRFTDLNPKEIVCVMNGENVRGNRIIDFDGKDFYLNGAIPVIFVNLTQPGSAKKQIDGILNRIPEPDICEMVFIIQDLQEIINGGDLRNALYDMNEFFRLKTGG